jgi:putative ABC transport system permease protein
LILTVASGVFVVITGLFVLINMAKFVSESRKEIGIFRAIGATKSDIRIMFMQQSLSYIALSIVGGGLLGIGLVYGLSGIMVTSAQKFITSTLGSSLVLTHTLNIADFMKIDFTMLGIYIAGLVLMTLFVSLIPAQQAAKVSPVEAIRNN